MKNRIAEAILSCFENQTLIRVEMNNPCGNVIRVFGVIDNTVLYDNFAQIYLDNQSEIEFSFGENIEYDEEEKCFAIYNGDSEMYLYL